MNGVCPPDENQMSTTTARSPRHGLTGAMFYDRQSYAFRSLWRAPVRSTMLYYVVAKKPYYCFLVKYIPDRPLALMFHRAHRLGKDGLLHHVLAVYLVVLSWTLPPL